MAKKASAARVTRPALPKGEAGVIVRLTASHVAVKWDEADIGESGVTVGQFVPEADQVVATQEPEENAEADGPQETPPTWKLLVAPVADSLLVGSLQAAVSH